MSKHVCPQDSRSLESRHALYALALLARLLAHMTVIPMTVVLPLVGVSSFSEGGGEAHISESQRRDVEAEGEKDGRYLMLRKVLLKLEAEVERPVQSNSLFRTTCKTKDRVCKVIIDSGSTENLVSMNMVEKLELETTSHPKPYKVSWFQKDTS
jgi:hypothetical protein